MDQKTEKLIRRVFLKIIILDGCWKWTGCHNSDGYGRMSFNGQNTGVHCVIWRIFYGDPCGFSVLHKCDNPGCPRPDHLFLGSQADNVADMVFKGRHAVMRGEKNPRAILSPSDVLAIRASKESKAILARRFDCTPENIHRIIERRSWRHV